MDPAAVADGDFHRRIRLLATVEEMPTTFSFAQSGNSVSVPAA